jgi:hypothetical protein
MKAAVLVRYRDRSHLVRRIGRREKSMPPAVLVPRRFDLDLFRHVQ